VAVIMDGNGRWAQQRGLSRVEGHKRGKDSVRAVVEASRRGSITTAGLDHAYGNAAGRHRL